MPIAQFFQDALKNVAMHEEQRHTHTYTEIQLYIPIRSRCSSHVFLFEPTF